MPLINKLLLYLKSNISFLIKAIQMPVYWYFCVSYLLISEDSIEKFHNRKDFSNINMLKRLILTESWSNSLILSSNKKNIIHFPFVL